MTPRRTPVLTGRVTAWVGGAGVLLLGVLVAIAWRTTSPLWFLTFPLLLLGVLISAAVVVLWILRLF